MRDSSLIWPTLGSKLGDQREKKTSKPRKLTATVHVFFRCYPPSPISLLLTFQEAQTVAVCLSSRDAGVVRERTGHTALTPLGHHELVHVNNWGLGSCLEALSLWMESVNLTLTVWWTAWTVLGETSKSVSLNLSSWVGQILQRKILQLSGKNVKPCFSTSGSLFGKRTGVLGI